MPPKARNVHKDSPSEGENQSEIKHSKPEHDGVVGGEDTDNTKHAAASSTPAGENQREEGDGDDPATRDDSMNDDPMGRSAREEVADRQADSDADEASTFTRTYLAQGKKDKNFDHGPNKQALISEAINNGLRLIGKGDEPDYDDDDATSETVNHIAVEDLDDFVQLVSAKEVDFSSRADRKMISTEYTYQAEVVPAHLVGAGPTEALSDQAGTMADVLSPRHVGSTGSPV